MASSKGSFHKRVFGIAGYGFLSAIAAAMWTSPLAGFTLSILVGLAAIGLRELHTRSLKHRGPIIRLYQLVTVLGSLAVFVSFFLVHLPLFIVVSMGILVVQWILLFFT